MTNPFYSSEQSELSKAVLQEVLSAVPAAVLIGGWGTWVRVGGPMSHDIDLILSRAELARLGEMVEDVSVSRHLGGTKWRGTWRSVHLGLYVPYQSRLGTNLQLRVEDLFTQAETANGYRVLTVPAHVATKVAALLDRPDSLPGEKDRGEILRLLDDPAAASAPTVIAMSSCRAPSEVAALLRATFGFLADPPSLNRGQRSRLREVERSWQEATARAAELGLFREASPAPGHDRGPSL